MINANICITAYTDYYRLGYTAVYSCVYNVPTAVRVVFVLCYYIVYTVYFIIIIIF